MTSLHTLHLLIKAQCLEREIARKDGGENGEREKASTVTLLS